MCWNETLCHSTCVALYWQIRQGHAWGNDDIPAGIEMTTEEAVQRHMFQRGCYRLTRGEAEFQAPALDRNILHSKISP